VFEIQPDTSRVQAKNYSHINLRNAKENHIRTQYVPNTRYSSASVNCYLRRFLFVCLCRSHRTRDMMKIHCYLNMHPTSLERGKKTDYPDEVRPHGKPRHTSVKILCSGNNASTSVGSKNQL
jgi:hypothetical protein